MWDLLEKAKVRKKEKKRTSVWKHQHWVFVLRTSLTSFENILYKQLWETVSLSTFSLPRVSSEWSAQLKRNCMFPGKFWVRCNWYLLWQTLHLQSFIYTATDEKQWDRRQFSRDKFRKPTNRRNLRVPSGKVSCFQEMFFKSLASDLLHFFKEKEIFCAFLKVSRKNT